MKVINIGNITMPHKGDYSIPTTGGTKKRPARKPKRLKRTSKPTRTKNG